MEGSPQRVDPQRLAGLVRRAQSGDAMACAELLELLTPAVTRWCGPIALDDGADAAQETLIVVLRRLPQLRDPAALFGWVRTIAVREAVRMAQRRPTMAELTDIPATDDPQLVIDVRDVLARLSPEHRAILMLRDLEGLNERRAAELLAVPVGTVKSRLARARCSFRKGWQS